VADDHPIFRAGLVQVLAANRALGIVAEVADGDLALQEIISKRPTVAILDFDLPRRTGLAVAKEIRRLRLETRPIILTAHSQETLFEAAIATGVQGYLLKENTAASVIECVQTVAGGGTFFSPLFSKYLLERGKRSAALREEKHGLASLTPSETRILKLIALSRSTREIAAELSISPATVDTHRKHICSKLDLHGPNSLLQFAIEHRAELV
jgi:two-component system response regulator NreC